jgi:hypothetical protein
LNDNEWSAGLFRNQPNASGAVADGFDFPFAGLKAGVFEREERMPEPVVELRPRAMLRAIQELGDKGAFGTLRDVAAGSREPLVIGNDLECRFGIGLNSVSRNCACEGSPMTALGETSQS